MWSKLRRWSLKNEWDAEFIFFFFKDTNLTTIIQVNMKNSKVYDIIFYFNEKELLQKRIIYLQSVVEKFIIINFGSETHFPDNTVVINNYKSKFSFFQKDFLNELIENENLKFIGRYDYLLFSKTKEIPSLDFIEEIKKTQNLNVITCVHTNFHWNTLMESPHIHLGTRVINVTAILQKKDLYKEFRLNNPFMNVRANSQKTGWSLNGLQEESQLIDCINFWGPEKVKDLITEKGIQYFKENHLSLDIPQKVIRLFTSKVGVPEVLSNTNLVERRNSKDFFICLEDYEINIPKKVLYGDYSYSDFREVFKKNEVLRILKKEMLFPDDKVHIKEKTELEYSVFTYSQILEGIPSEMF